MKISALHREFKQYALLEKGMTPAVHRSILCSLRMLSSFCQTEQLNRLSSEAIRSFLYHGTRDRGWAPKTYRNHWQYLKLFFDFCRLRGYMRSNPLRSIGKPRLPETLPRCLSREDATRILYYTFYEPWRYRLEAARNYTIIATLLMTGLRLQELLNLQTQDVDLDGGSLLIRRGKGRKDRLVPIHPRLQPILREYIQKRREDGAPAQWLFTGARSNRQLSQKDVRRVCKTISVSSGVKFTPHMLRHTFGRELADAGVDIKVVKRILGHAQLKTTEIYSHLSTRTYRNTFLSANIY